LAGKRNDRKSVADQEAACTTHRRKNWPPLNGARLADKQPSFVNSLGLSIRLAAASLAGSSELAYTTPFRLAGYDSPLSVLGVVRPLRIRPLAIRG